MEAPSKACPCIHWGCGPPPALLLPLSLLALGGGSLAVFWGHSCPSPHSLAHFQGWMAHLAMTLCLG